MRIDVFSLRVLRSAQEIGLVAILDRGGIGNARPHAQDLGIVVMKHFHVFPHFGTRAHEAHVAGEHVDQLRQLVELERPQELADLGDPRIGAEGDQSAALGSVLDHGTEFEDAKGTEVATDPFLAEEDQGPGDVAHTSSAMTNSTGDSKASANAEIIMSNSRLINVS